MFSDEAMDTVLPAVGPCFVTFFRAACAAAAAACCLQAHSSLHRQQLVAHHPQIGQRKQRLELQRVLLQTPVAHLHISKLPLDHPKGVLHLGPDTCLDLLHLVYERVYGVGLFIQLFALARAHRYVPRHASPGIRALVHALIARVTKPVFFLSVQQAVALYYVRHVARGANDGVHQS